VSRLLLPRHFDADGKRFGYAPSITYGNGEDVRLRQLTVSRQIKWRSTSARVRGLSARTVNQSLRTLFSRRGEIYSDKGPGQLFPNKRRGRETPTRRDRRTVRRNRTRLSERAPGWTVRGTIVYRVRVYGTRANGMAD